MDEHLNIIIKPFKIIMIVVVLIMAILIVLLSYGGKYDSNYISVSVNNIKMHYYIEETKYNGPFVNSGIASYNEIDDDNKVKNSDRVKLKVDEYEVYDSNGIRTDRENTTRVRYKKANKSKVTLDLKKDGKEIYNDKINYEYNVNQGKGNYEAHVYITRWVTPITNIKSKISFYFSIT